MGGCLHPLQGESRGIGLLGGERSEGSGLALLNCRCWGYLKGGGAEMGGKQGHWWKDWCEGADRHGLGEGTEG